MANNTLLASEDFSSGSLSALKWTAIATQVKSQVTGTPFVAEAPSVGTAGRQYYSGIVWPNDQISELTVASYTAGTSSFDLWVRVQAGAYSGYVASFSGTTLSLYSCTAGAFTLLTSAGSLVAAAGDVWAIQVAGSVLTVYQNNKPIVHWGNATFTSGNPGFSQTAAGTVANSQIGSWRGYGVQQQDGIWTKKQVILAPLAGDLSGGAGGVAAGTLLYEGGSQLGLGAGNVFKLWFSAGAPTAETNTYYAESTDGLTWTRRGSAVLTSQGSPFIIKNGATYYLYTQPSGSTGAGNFNVYTSSDGIVWALQASSILNFGGVGTWDHTIMWYLQPVAIINGTWYALYSGGNDTTLYQLSLGLATSPDGITWTKYVGNPVLIGANNGSIVNGGAIAQIGNTYYAWFYGNQPGGGGQSGAETSLDPGEGVRYKTTDFIHWTFDSHSVHRSQMYEGCNFHGGQCYPNAIMDFGGKALMFIQSAPSDNGAPLVYQLSVATGPAALSSIVSQPEDATVKLASDAFTSGVGPLSANWSTLSGMSALQIVGGNLLEAGSTGTNCGARYTGKAFANDQYSEFKLTSLGSSCTVYPIVRCQSNGACYAFAVIGAAGSLNTIGIYKVSGGVGTLIGSTGQITPSLNDVFRLSVVGNVLTAYQNDYQLLSVEDFSNVIPSGGNPGIIMNAATLANAQISLWNGGNTGVVPTYLTFQPMLVWRGFGH